MAKKIAVFVDASGCTISLHEPGQIVVYGKQESKWMVERRQPFTLLPEKGMAALRAQIRNIMNFLGDCKVFAARSISGVAYYELEKQQLSIWEIDGCAEDFLDDIDACKESVLPAQDNGADPPAVSETFPGCYRISLTDIQLHNTGFTTKQALLPFLRRGDFLSLEVFCNHLPPWLELELATGGYLSHLERISKEELKVLITSTNCNDGPCSI